MNQTYGRDLDLNLLRVLVVVADTGSVTGAAARLYLTQPAVSAALKRLQTAVGARLFVRRGRGLALTARGQGLVAAARPLLAALVDAALAPPGFDPRTSERTFRVGLSDASESWLLPALLRVLAKEAPAMTVVAVPVQFRTAGALLAAGAVDVAVTVADELPAGVRRKSLFRGGGFRCVSDPRHAKLGRRPTLARYLAHEHVVVSYNADLRGVVEDVLGVRRRVRCSVASFLSLGAIVEGSALVATVPERVAAELVRERPKLASAPTPFSLGGDAAVELLWPAALDDDPAALFLRARIERIASRRRE